MIEKLQKCNMKSYSWAFLDFFMKILPIFIFWKITCSELYLSTLKRAFQNKIYKSLTKFATASFTKHELVIVDY